MNQYGFVNCIAKDTVPMSYLAISNTLLQRFCYIMPTNVAGRFSAISTQSTFYFLPNLRAFLSTICSYAVKIDAGISGRINSWPFKIFLTKFPLEFHSVSSSFFFSLGFILSLCFSQYGLDI